MKKEKVNKLLDNNEGFKCRLPEGKDCICIETEEELKKVTKNNVSYFEAGYKAGLLDCMKPRNSVDDLFYKTNDGRNRVIELLKIYDMADYDPLATDILEDYIEGGGNYD